MKLLILFLFILGNHLNGDIACLYDGRICPHDVALQKWTEGYTEEMSSHLWELHLRGPRGLSEAKLFNVSSVPLKRLLHLDLGREEFSHRELVQSLWSDRQIFRSISGLRILDALQTQYGEHPFTHNSPISLDVIVKGLRVVWDGAHIIINQRPQSEPWAFLEVGQPIISLDQAQLPDGMVRREGVVLDLEDLYQQIYKFEMRADSSFLILPDHRNLSKWHPLRALLEPNSPKLAVDNSLIIKIKEDLAGYLSGHKQALVSLRSHLEQIYLS
ncbi:MAG: hypothetical protein KDK40_02370, partial [Chlamydiia bacterium]|nr:hypothetical protein [Chlamydiia bacterium]